MSCGERTRAYGNRMDNVWALRAAFAMARGYRDAQDAFCARAEAGLWDEIGTEAYPDDEAGLVQLDRLVEWNGRLQACILALGGEVPE